MSICTNVHVDALGDIELTSRASVNGGNIFNQICVNAKLEIEARSE
jgi:hypothetical protein